MSAKYDPVIYDLFSLFFQTLPLAYCLNQKVLVLHGGLFSDDNVTLQDLRDIDRIGEPKDGI